MSCNYAENLSHYENKGKLGLPEVFDGTDEVEKKCIKLAEFLKNSNHTVVHTGAGVSTSAGIPDFRGPNGVWTLEKKGQKPSISVSWNDAKPTKTHMALLALQRAGYISYIITQNIDGLHLRSGMPRICLAELHGNLFVDECEKCKRQYVRQEAVETVGLKSQGISCPGRRAYGRQCRGKLHDTILDWEDSLPDADLDLAHMHSCSADLSLCLGTTLQIVPSGNLPVHTKKRGGKLVICNLQPTKQDRHADLIIHSYVDDILTRVLEILQISIPQYDRTCDPVLITRNTLSTLGYPFCTSKEARILPQLPSDFEPIEWTVRIEWMKDKNLIEKSKRRKIIKMKRNSPTKEHSPVRYEGLKKTKLDNGVKSTKLDMEDKNIKLDTADKKTPKVYTENINEFSAVIKHKGSNVETVTNDESKLENKHFKKENSTDKDLKDFKKDETSAINNTTKEVTLSL